MDVDGGLRALRGHNECGYNVYLGVNPRFENDGLYRGRKEDVEKVIALHADVDNVRPEDVEKALANAGLKPAVLVSTNQQVGGTHAYLRLRAPVALHGPAKIEEMERFNCRLISLFKFIDPKNDSVQDVSRVLRLPGMTNVPNAKKLAAGRQSSPVVLYLADPDSSYTLEELDALLPSLPEVEGARPGLTRSLAKKRRSKRMRTSA